MVDEARDAASAKMSEIEPRWPALVAVLAFAGLFAALPDELSLGPRWLALVVVCVLSVPIVLTHHRGHHTANTIFGFLLAAVLTCFMLWSLVLLVLALPQHKQPPVELLRSAACLWLSNVLIFAIWYWRLDAGGPHARWLRKTHTTGAFLFPQMTLRHSEQPKSSQTSNDKDDTEMSSDPTTTAASKMKTSAPPWSPRFVDYLFLAFNTSTALSPTDTPVLSRWAKVLAMMQAIISLTVVVILAARAVNMM